MVSDIFVDTEFVVEIREIVVELRLDVFTFIGRFRVVFAWLGG